jgi:hypothetical protein
MRLIVATLALLASCSGESERPDPGFAPATSPAMTDAAAGAAGAAGSAAGGNSGGSAGSGGSGGLATDASAGTGGTADASAEPDGVADGAGGVDAADASADASTGDAADAPPAGDGDGDGIDDAQEMTWAKAYFPFYSIDPADKCKTHGVLFRLTRHPKNVARLAIWYDVLYDQDCGANGHPGDSETFGALVDPAKPAPEGILALRAISHQGTICQHVSTCGVCSGQDKCESAPSGGKTFPVVYSSVNKHGGYVKESTCDLSVICDFGGCALAPQPDAPPFVNAGEPGKPLVSDLTTQGFITGANGWKNQGLMNYDPWGSSEFGGAGTLASKLTDAQFVIDPAGCP